MFTLQLNFWWTMNKTFEKIKQSRFFLAIGAVLCSLLWGSAFPAIRLAHKHFDTEPLANHMAFAGIRFFIAGIFVLGFIQKNKLYWRNCPKKGLMLVALFQVVLQYILFYWGLNVAPAVLGAILVSTGSFWWVLLAPMVDKTESVNFKQFFAVGVGFLGVVICVMNKEGGGDSYLSGLFFIFSSLCGTIATLFVRPMNRKVPPHFLVGASLMLGGLCLMLLVPGASWGLVMNFNASLGLLTIWLAFVSSAAFSLWYYLVTIFDVPRLSGYRMLIPVCGVLESVLLLEDESLSWNYLIGGTVVLLGIFLLEKMQRKPASSSSS